MAPIHIKELQGCCVAVDTYSWLHKGALSCSRELCRGLPTSRHVEYCMHRVNLLRHYGVKPILVFDGGLLPMKGEQENKRARARKENLARALEHESNGNSRAAYECYQKAVDISPAIAYDLIQVLKQENVYYIVAPYEADAQMTFLAVNKLVDAVITEDSDLIPFGCPRIIFKMDKFGQGVEFRYHLLHQNKELNFAGFTKQMLLEMCILSGCDYLQSLPGMGLKKAHALISKFKSFDKVIKHLAFSGMSLSPLYEESFKKAILTFQHQRVYDPNVQDSVNLLGLPDNFEEDLEFLGPAMPQPVAKAIAEGMIDPITKQPFQQGEVYAGVAADNHQIQNLRAENKKKLELPAQKNVLTNYFCFASLEAKRKFKAPRIATKHPDIGSSPSSGDDVQERAIAHEINPSPTSIINDSEIDLLQETGADLDSSFDGTEGSQEKTPLQQSRNSIHKPCLLLQKERQQNNKLPAVREKTRPVAENVTVKSSYFHHNLGVENDPCLENEKVIIRSPYFQAKTSAEGGASSNSDKLVVRSSYFKRKAIPPNDFDSSIDEQEVNYPSPWNHRCDKTRPESVSAEPANECYEESNSKSKTSSADGAVIEHVTSRHNTTEASIPVQGSCHGIDDSPNKQKPEEGKFGCNISHLGHYSDISEKSMEKFVSVISSFNFSSSGSRASGLRAPLGDVRNTHPGRQATVSDISRFSYVPNKKKRSAAMSQKSKTKALL